MLCSHDSVHNKLKQFALEQLVKWLAFIKKLQVID